MNTIQYNDILGRWTQPYFRLKINFDRCHSDVWRLTWILFLFFKVGVSEIITIFNHDDYLIWSFELWKMIWAPRAPEWGTPLYKKNIAVAGFFVKTTDALCSNPGFIVRWWVFRAFIFYYSYFEIIIHKSNKLPNEYFFSTQLQPTALRYFILLSNIKPYGMYAVSLYGYTTAPHGQGP